MKSANIGLIPRGDALYAKLYDCGIANAMHVAEGVVGAFTRGLAAGTRGYMAPETYGGAYSIQSEVYSFGVVLLEVLVGKRVGFEPITAMDVEANDNGVQWRVARADPGCRWSGRSLDQLAVLVFECIRSQSTKRPENMGAVLERLQAARATP